MGNNDEGMFDVTVISSPVKIGNGVVLMATKINKRRVTAIQADGTSLDLILEDYKYVPDLWVNPFFTHEGTFQRMEYWEQRH
jgi:hypothetical protein